MKLVNKINGGTVEVSSTPKASGSGDILSPSSPGFQTQGSRQEE